MMTKFQRGQSMVEFAIVLPFFFIMCYAVIVMVLLFGDYVQVQYQARSIARSCSVLSADTDAEKQKVVSEYNSSAGKPILFLYQWHFDERDIRYVPSDTDNGYWQVDLEVEPKDTNSGLWALAVVVDKKDIPDIQAHCTMYSENDLKPKNDTNNNPGR